MIKQILLISCLLAIALSACTESDKTYKEGGLTDEMKQVLLDAHNEFRQKVASGSQDNQPGASNMLKVYWDDDLETRSQELSDSCVYAHSQDSGKGENIAWASSSTGKEINEENLKQLVQLWYDEVEFLNSSQVAQFTNESTDPEEDVGHYTQVVWAGTEAIGCGATVYEEDGSEAIMLFCQYTPPGNYLGNAIYEQGDACTDCPDDYECDSDYDSLCSDPSKTYDVIEKSDDDDDDDGENQNIIKLCLSVLIAISVILI